MLNSVALGWFVLGDNWKPFLYAIAGTFILMTIIMLVLKLPPFGPIED